MKLVICVISAFVVNWISPLHYNTVAGWIVNTLAIGVLYFVLYGFYRVHQCRNKTKSLHAFIISEFQSLDISNPREMDATLDYLEAKLIEFRAWALPISNQRALSQEPAFQWADSVENAIRETRENPTYHTMMMKTAYEENLYMA